MMLCYQGTVHYIEVLYRYVVHTVLRREVRGDFNIHGTKYFFKDAVFHQKSKNYDVISLTVPLVGQKTCPLHEMLTQLVITEIVF